MVTWVQWISELSIEYTGGMAVYSLLCVAFVTVGGVLQIGASIMKKMQNSKGTRMGKSE